MIIKFFLEKQSRKEVREFFCKSKKKKEKQNKISEKYVFLDTLKLIAIYNYYCGIFHVSEELAKFSITCQMESFGRKNKFVGYLM